MQSMKHGSSGRIDGGGEWQKLRPEFSCQWPARAGARQLGHCLFTSCRLAVALRERSPHCALSTCTAGGKALLDAIGPPTGGRVQGGIGSVSPATKLPAPPTAGITRGDGRAGSTSTGRCLPRSWRASGSTCRARRVAADSAWHLLVSGDDNRARLPGHRIAQLPPIRL